jgi:hypothetical protein
MFYIIVILAAVFALPAKADEALKYRFVQHATSNQNQQVDDVDRHVIGVSRAVGIAFFPDGSMPGTDVVLATYDPTPPNGTTNGYGITTFADGSELWASFTGTIKFGNPTTEKGTTTVIGGKGRYAGSERGWDLGGGGNSRT